MSNLFWFNFLAFIGLAIAAITIYECRHRIGVPTMLIFFLFATSLPWLGEFIVLGLFDSYIYKPGVFQDPWAENLLAHLILNSALWPGVSIPVVVYSLGYRWMVLISLAFVAVETLFLKFGLYEHNWWKSYMTGIAVFLYLVIAKASFVRMTKNPSRLSRATIFYLISIVIIHTPTSLLLLWGKQYYKLDLLENLIGNKVRASIIFVLSYQMIETLLFVFFVCILSKWYWKLAPFLIALAGQVTLANRGILIFQENWNPLYSIFLYFGMIAICIYIEKYLLPQPKPG